MTGTDGQSPAAYLIVLKHVIVAQDIALTVAEFAPDAPVLSAASPTEALPLLQGIDRIDVAFVGVAPQDWPGSALEQAVAARGGRVVLIGEAAELHGERLGFRVLVRPFTTADVLHHLAGG